MRRHVWGPLISIVVLYGAGFPFRASAQATGQFLCSGGTRDGAACNSSTECPGGVCVIAQGVCNGGVDDGLPCDCPGGTCSAQNTCSGGTSAGLSCDQTYNCTGSKPCTGTQRVCAGGDNKGYSCLNNSQCPGSQCLSTGKVCVGGAYDGYSCVDTNDCPGGGSCTGALPTPVPTSTSPVSPTATRSTVPTATRSGVPTATGSIGPTATRSTGPTATHPSGLTPTHTPAPPTPTVPVPTATQTPTRTASATPTGPTKTPSSSIAIVQVDAPSGSQEIVVYDASRLPESGQLYLPNGQQLQYYKDDRYYNVLHFVAASLTSGIPAGAKVVGESITPPAHTAVVRELAPKGEREITVLDSSALSGSGVLSVPGQKIDYSKDTVHHNLLYLAEPLARDLPAGTVVTDQRGNAFRAEGEACAIGVAQGWFGLPILTALGFIVVAAIRRRVCCN